MRNLQAEVARVDGPARPPNGAQPVVVAAIQKNHLSRQISQATLRDTIALWAGWQRTRGLQDREIQRAFWHTYGVDVMSAQVLGAREAAELEQRIQTALDGAGVVST